MTTKEFDINWNKYKKLAYKCYLSYKVDSIHRDDLLQVGKIGMIKGLSTYKEGAGSTETTWVRLHMQKEQMEYLNKNLRTIRLPQNVIYDKERETLPTEYLSSLDSAAYDDSTDPLYSTIAYEDNQEDNSNEAIRDVLNNNLNKIKPKYQKILNLRYFQEKTYEEIAIELNVSRENVRQLHDKAINKLQELFNVEQKINKNQRIKPQKRK